LLGAEPVTVVGAEILVRAERSRHAATGAACELLGDDRVGDEVGAGPTVDLLVLRAEQPELRCVAEHLAVWEVALALPLLRVRTKLRLHPVADRVAERIVLFGEQAEPRDLPEPRAI